jgi:hypothetical protein
VEDEDQKFGMVHPNPFIDDEAEEDPDYVDSSDEHSHCDKDEIDYYLQRTENDSNTDSAEPIQDFTISLTEYSRQPIFKSVIINKLATTVTWLGSSFACITTILTITIWTPNGLAIFAHPDPIA